MKFLRQNCWISWSWFKCDLDRHFQRYFKTNFCFLHSQPTFGKSTKFYFQTTCSIVARPNVACKSNLFLQKKNIAGEFGVSQIIDSKELAFPMTLTSILNVIWRSAFVFQVETTIFDSAFRESIKFYIQMPYSVKGQGQNYKRFLSRILLWYWFSF